MSVAWVVSVVSVRAAGALVAALLVGSVSGLAVVSDARPAGAGSLAEVRRFIRAQRTARFTSVGQSFAEDPGAEEPMTSERMTGRGELRLPAEAHVVAHGDEGYTTESIVHVDDHFSREADSPAALADAEWERQTDWLQGLEGLGGRARALAVIYDTGLPIHLDALLEDLPRARRLGAGRIQGRFLPEDFPVADELEAEAEAEVEPETEAGSGSLTVTVEFGPGGRLDRLAFEAVGEMDGTRSGERLEFSFTDWGAAVAFTLPDFADVGRERLEERRGPSDEGEPDASLAELARRLTVFAPAELPAGWELGPTGATASDDGLEVCGYFSREYGPSHDDLRLALASSSVSCDPVAIREDVLRGARRVEVAGRQGWLLTGLVEVDFTDIRGVVVVVDIGGTRVVGVTNMDERFLVEVLGRLEPVDPFEEQD